MRPIRLTFQAFGSYPGIETVDFEALARRGLFVVSGPTGAGKTTVFDAMVYALYGALPGQRSSDGEPRSHHAAADVETMVTLDFEVDGSRYRVERSPQWERPKKRGAGTTTQPAKATLAKLVGEATETLATQSNLCTQACEDVIGLGARQFQRVVLLPQGKFTEFLISTDDEREKLLRQLFGGDLYEQAVVWLKEQVRLLDAEVGETEIQVEHHRSNALTALDTVDAAWLEQARSTPLDTLDDEGVRAAVEALQPVCKEREVARDAVRDVATKATERRIAAQTEAELYDATEKARSELAELEAAREAVSIDKEAAEASARARPVMKAADEEDAARGRAERAGNDLAAARAAIASGFGALGRPMPAFEAVAVATAVQHASRQLEEEQRALTAATDAAAQAVAAEVAIRDARNAQAGLKASVAGVQGAIAELKAKASALAPLADALSDRRLRREDSKRRLDTRTNLKTELTSLDKAEQAETAARRAYETLMARFVATQAPRLAQSLEPGTPCPVCGATAHPALAVLSEGDEVDHDAVDVARGSWSHASATVASHRTAVDTLRATLGNEAGEPVEHFRVALAAAEQGLSEAQEVADELSEARLALTQLDEELARAVRLEQQSGLELAGLEERARSARNDADQRETAAAGIDTAALAASVLTLKVLQSATADIAALFDAVTVTATQLTAARERLAEQIRASGYETMDAARKKRLPPADEERFLKRATDWQGKLNQQTTRLAGFVEQGVPVTRPNLETLAAEAQSANAQAGETATAFTTALNALNAARDAIDQVFSISGNSADLRRRRDTARTVFKTCNGDGPSRVKLERWVLAGELDRVTQAANVHLARMTSSRYTLRRVTGSRGGLTLEVFDAHTGRARNTASLSGGEQFQASLALALGLADVVSHGGAASGKQFEALFVDEGFGSLDSDALDDAMTALSMLQAAGRVVGAITHVEAMKERLHVGIEVKRLADGKGSTLVMHP